MALPFFPMGNIAVDGHLVLGGSEPFKTPFLIPVAAQYHGITYMSWLEKLG
jgi:hypothetical protein